MEVNHNDHNRKIEIFEELGNLRIDSYMWCQQAEDLSTSLGNSSEILAISDITQKFNEIIHSLDKFVEDSSSHIESLKHRSKELFSKHRSKHRLRRRAQNKAQALSSKEKRIDSNEKLWYQALLSLNTLWSRNLADMESSFSRQKHALNEVFEVSSQKILELETELADTINKDEHVPNLDLGKLVPKPTPPRVSVRSNTSLRFSSDEDLISNRSAFSLGSEAGESHRSNSLVRKPKRKIPPLPPVLQISSSSNSDILDDNFELDLRKIPAEESVYRGNESDSENISFHPDEIKDAVKILKKYHLLSPGNNHLLLQMAELAKEPNNPEVWEPMLQLAKKKHRRFRNRPSPVFSDMNLALTSPKAIVNFEGDLKQTIPSSDRQQSSRDENLEAALDAACEGGTGELGLSALLTISDKEGSLELETNVRETHLNSVKTWKGFQMVSPVSGIREGTPGKKEHSAGISSTRVTEGWRDRMALKTVGSENSEKLFTPSTKEEFMYQFNC